MRNGKPELGNGNWKMVTASFSRSCGEAPLCPLRHLSPLSPTHPQNVPTLPPCEALLLRATSYPLLRSTNAPHHRFAFAIWRLLGQKGLRGPRGLRARLTGALHLQGIQTRSCSPASARSAPTLKHLHDLHVLHG